MVWFLFWRCFSISKWASWNLHFTFYNVKELPFTFMYSHWSCLKSSPISNIKTNFWKLSTTWIMSNLDSMSGQICIYSPLLQQNFRGKIPTLTYELLHLRRLEWGNGACESILTVWGNSTVSTKLLYWTGSLLIRCYLFVLLSWTDDF